MKHTLEKFNLEYFNKHDHSFLRHPTLKVYNQQFIIFSLKAERSKTFNVFEVFIVFSHFASISTSPHFFLGCNLALRNYYEIIINS